MGTAQKSTSITHKRESPKQRVVYNIHPPLVALSLKRSFDVKKMEGNGFLLGNLAKIVSTNIPSHFLFLTHTNNRLSLVNPPS